MATRTKRRKSESSQLPTEEGVHCVPPDNDGHPPRSRESCRGLGWYNVEGGGQAASMDDKETENKVNSETILPCPN